MEQIFKYLINMMPYMLINIPIIVIIRTVLIWKRKKEINWYHEIALIIFILFITGLFSQTIIPKLEIGADGSLKVFNEEYGDINLVPFKVFYETYLEVFKNGYINYFIINFIGNIVMFIPIGFFIPLLWKVKTNGLVILMGFLTSFFIEFCQLFISRGTDIDDLWINTLGVIVGLRLYKLIYTRYKEKLKKFKY